MTTVAQVPTGLIPGTRYVQTGNVLPGSRYQDLVPGSGMTNRHTGTSGMILVQYWYWHRYDTTTWYPKPRRTYYVVGPTTRTLPGRTYLDSVLVPWCQVTYRDQSCKWSIDCTVVLILVPGYRLVSRRINRQTIIPIGRSNSANSQNSNILPYSYILKKWKFAQFCKFCDIPSVLFLYRLKSTQTRFAPLRALTPFEVYIGPYLVSLNGQKVLVVLVVVILFVSVVDPISN